MIVDVNTAINNYTFLVRNYKKKDELNREEREYYDSMERAIVLEIRLMVQKNSSNMYHSVLSMYLKDRSLKQFVIDIFRSKDMLTDSIVTLSWNTGNINILQSCIELDIELYPQKNISGAIRSNSTYAVDMCVSAGASLSLPLLPYRSCNSVEMVRYISSVYGCKLYNLTRKLHGNQLVSAEYIYMGGYIEEMGELNATLQERGNLDRSLPIKKAYVRSLRPNTCPDRYNGIGRFILLPGSIVKNIASYI